jgi:hypothetical protein
MNFLPEDQKPNNTYSAQEILDPLSAVCCPDRPEMAHPQVTLRFDNALTHSAAEARDPGMDHLLYSLDLALCDPFLFGYLKGKFCGQIFPQLEDRFQAVDEIWNENLPDTFDGVP